MTVTPPRGLGGDPQISTVHFQLVSFSRCARSSSPSLALPSRALLSPVRVLAFARARVWCERALCGTSACTFSRALLPHSHGAALERNGLERGRFFIFRRARARGGGAGGGGVRAAAEGARCAESAARCAAEGRAAQARVLKRGEIRFFALNVILFSLCASATCLRTCELLGERGEDSACT